MRSLFCLIYTNGVFFFFFFFFFFFAYFSLVLTNVPSLLLTFLIFRCSFALVRQTIEPCIENKV